MSVRDPRRELARILMKLEHGEVPTEDELRWAVGFTETRVEGLRLQLRTLRRDESELSRARRRNPDRAKLRGRIAEVEFVLQRLEQVVQRARAALEEVG